MTLSAIQTIMRIILEINSWTTVTMNSIYYLARYGLAVDKLYLKWIIIKQIIKNNSHWPIVNWSEYQLSWIQSFKIMQIYMLEMPSNIVNGCYSHFVHKIFRQWAQTLVRSRHTTKFCCTKIEKLKTTRPKRSFFRRVNRSRIISI